MGKIKRGNMKPKMATAENYISKDQPSIADDPNIKNAFYDAPMVITMFAPKDFLFATDDCAVAAGLSKRGRQTSRTKDEKE